MTRITDAPTIIAAPNPTAPRKLKQAPRTHSRLTQHNIPGSTLPIVNLANRRNVATTPPLSAPNPIGPRRSPRNVPRTGPTTPHTVPLIPIKGGGRTRSYIRKEAINFLTDCVKRGFPDLCTPAPIPPESDTTSNFDFRQVATPMVHPTTGETISSYKRLKDNPATAEIWQTALAKTLVE